MALTYSKTGLLDRNGNPALAIGAFRAPDFSLPGVDGKTYSLGDFREAKALLVIFLCNHCPYVIAVQERLNRLAKRFAPQGLATIGINSNDPEQKPDDDFESMKRRAREQGYVFPYVQDLTQEVARAYDAACTPDIYLFENERNSESFVLRYHGRLDDSWKDERAVTRHDLADAVQALLSGTRVSAEQTPSMGCSIKWRQR
jgi:peroxiredoxin